MTDYQFPTDPAAYGVEITRHGCGPVEHIKVFVKADGAVLDEWSEAFDRLATLLGAAHDLGRYGPDAMPSDEHIIMAALADFGLLGEGDDGLEDESALAEGERLILEAKSTYDAGHVAAEVDAMRGTLLHVVVNDSDRSFCTAGDMIDANIYNDEACGIVIDVALGKEPEGRLGGGAMPLVVITRVGAPACPLPLFLAPAATAIEAFDVACQGDSNDDEHDAAMDMRRELEALAINPLVLGAPDLLASARAVVAAWEGGDLAGAVRSLASAIAKAEGC